MAASTPLRRSFLVVVVLLLVAASMVVTTVPLSPVHAAESACGQVPRASFDDVPDDAVHADGVDCLVWYGIAHGRAYDEFGARQRLRRAQFATLLDAAIAAAGVELPDPATDRFDDVSGVHAGAIERLAAAGILTGRTAHRFEPDAPVYRDQLATLLVNAYERVTGERPDAASHRFTDLDDTLHADAIARALHLGLVTGTGPETYEPRQVLPRGQAASVTAAWLGAVGPAGASAHTGYQARITPLDSRLRAGIERADRHPGCAAPEELRLVTLVHTDVEGTDRWGRLVVHADVADDVGTAFGDLYQRGFAIERIEPVQRYGGDDAASMAANNTSAFNCRTIAGTSRLSEHATGTAIDINPVQNPYVGSGDYVAPEAGRGYLDRADVRPGMLTSPGPVEAFTAIGWGWGGDWNNSKDYQHVSRSGG